ncbi:lauroyl-Kdo(2)-lipid IV(A) myristoyltransferase [Pseudaeromonas sp. ZJS20]|uniref:lauroyl-Kdo(2)-lipid IV(A) myristoyltransferase n=1 Tax=Pseudaeromonas aegiceratis TaxID=3153928 RepID=UPI00390CCCE2
MSQSDPVFDHRFQARYLHPRFWLTWLSLGALYLLAWLPIRLRDALAGALAPLVVHFAKKQCFIARTNLALCFPEQTQAEREATLLASIRVGLQCFFAFAEPSCFSARRMLSRYAPQGWDQVKAAMEDGGPPVIILIPHTWAIDAGGMFFAIQGYPMCTMMHSAKNGLYDWFINRQRASYGGRVYERSAGLKAVIKSMREGHHFFYLPDQDHGAEASLFVPFFGVPKATLPALPRLVKLTGARVFPLLAGYDASTGRYDLAFGEALAPYPTGDLTADTARMNQAIEDLLAPRAEQYMWFLKYFQTRPEGRAVNFYKEGIRQIRGR